MHPEGEMSMSTLAQLKFQEGWKLHPGLQWQTFQCSTEHHVMPLALPEGCSSGVGFYERGKNS